MATEAATRGATDLLRMLANSQRLKILSILAAGEMSIGDLRAHIALTQSSLSQHLTRLRSQHLDATRRCADDLHRIVDDEALARARSLGWPRSGQGDGHDQLL
jgi:DNA-binding transcriptional ArsR family regulator